MKLCKLKYGCSVGKDFFAPGTIVELCEPSNYRVQKLFPGIKKIAGSNQVAIIFPGRNSPTIHDENSLYFEDVK